MLRSVVRAPWGAVMLHKRKRPVARPFSRHRKSWITLLFFVRLLLAKHRNGDVDHDIGMKRDGDRAVADLLDRTGRHAHLRALDLESLLAQRLDDVVVGDRAEEAPVDARFLRDLHHEA